MNDTNYKIPERKWYNLEQAVKKIQNLTKSNFDVSDLIHFWLIGKIELCIQVHSDSPNEVCEIGGIKFLSSEIDVFYENFNLSEIFIENIVSIRTKSEFIRLVGELNINVQDMVMKNVGGINGCILGSDKSEKLFIRGFMSLPVFSTLHLTEYDVLNKGINLFDSPMLVTPSCHNEREKFYLVFNEEFSDNKFFIKKEFLYVLDKDLDDFIKDQANPPKQDEIKEPSRTIKENQINFIKGLLYLHYGIKTPNEAKNAMNTGKLGKDIARLKREQPGIEDDQNFKFPSSVTLFNWYGGI